MANRWFQQFRFSLEKYVVDLYLKATIGATGAPTLVASSSKGITSITRTGAGAYTIVLQDSYYRFLMATGTLLNATTPTATGFYVVSETVATLATKAINVQYVGQDGLAADPANGAIMYMQFSLSNSGAL